LKEEEYAMPPLGIPIMECHDIDLLRTEELPAAILRKLEHLSLVDYLNCLPRNLSVFFNRAE
jgi:hypothetical protein